MKKILITGANSYIGTSLENWLKKSKNDYSIFTIDMMNDQWKKKDFSLFDVIFHVAGIAHVTSSFEMDEIYYKVNCSLAIETAKKAKNEGIKQFIFMSSIIVYGECSNINKKKVITADTIPVPSNSYGNSKLQAEEGLNLLRSDDFKVVILRPPMIYGKGSKGNYPKLAKAAKSLPIFPYIENERSMLHIDNLCEFIKLIIDNNESGLFFPQNCDYVKTSEMVKLISEFHGKKIILTKLFNPFLFLLSSKLSVINKIFGSLVYDKNMSNYKVNYRIRDLSTSINLTED